MNTSYQVDMMNAPAGSRPNAQGFLRNSQWFWREMLKNYPKLFSPDNAQLIRQNRAPQIDCQWTEHFPSHTFYLGSGLIHHHINGGQFATPLPAGAHQQFHLYFHQYYYGPLPQLNLSP